MKIKKFVGSTDEEAMQKARDEFGSEAIILTTRQLREKGFKGLFNTPSYEVTAAIDEDASSAASRSVVQRRGNRGEGGQKSDLADNLSELKTMLGISEQGAVKADAPQPSKIASNLHTTPQKKEREGGAGGAGDQLSLSQEALQKSRQSSQKPSSLDAGTAPTKETVEEHKQVIRGIAGRLVARFTEEDLATEQQKTTKEQVEVAPPTSSHSDMDEIRRLVREEVRRAQKSVAAGISTSEEKEEVGSVRFLMQKGVSRLIAIDIEEAVAQRVQSLPEAKRTDAERINAIKGEIAKRILVTGPITLRAGLPTFAVAVGPSGVGKTTVLMKIAIMYANELNKRVAFLSLDSKRGSREQIASLSAEWGIPAKVLNSQQELEEAVALFSSRDLVLVDTVGTNQYQWQQVDSLLDLLADIRDPEIFLTVSATTKDLDVYGTAQEFARMRPKGMIFTKLDETISHGILVNVSEKTGMGLAYLSSGKELGTGLKIADPHQVARGVLAQHNSQMFQQVRELAQ
ncbi:hypothetical protein JYU14_03085 [Simkania negevensis]|uniref:Flagella-associated GTP-binding protein n=1 Tax=Simkania negevensis TaxID=83561 RepID=A0ABS3ASF0_9BACT|nr:hypothetical protein [Simkania negevensis]